MDTRINARTPINKEVTITAWYFRNKKNLQSYPRRMEYNDQTYTFAEGLRYIVQKGRNAIQLFDMTDGTTKYRLKFDDQEHLWTLVSMSAERAF